jgi:hypothetical protein
MGFRATSTWSSCPLCDYRANLHLDENSYTHMKKDLPCMRASLASKSFQTKYVAYSNITAPNGSFNKLMTTIDLLNICSYLL